MVGREPVLCCSALGCRCSGAPGDCTAGWQPRGLPDPSQSAAAPESSVRDVSRPTLPVQVALVLVLVRLWTRALSFHGLFGARFFLHFLLAISPFKMAPCAGLC